MYNTTKPPTWIIIIWLEAMHVLVASIDGALTISGAGCEVTKYNNKIITKSTH
jgi:hypothetical protein